MSSLLSFRRKRTSTPAIVANGGVICYNGDMLYMSNTEKFLTFTVTSKRGAIRATFSLDEQSREKLQWMLGVREYEPVE